MNRLNANKIKWPIFQWNTWLQINHVLCCIMWWQRYAMDICLIDSMIGPMLHWFHGPSRHPMHEIHTPNQVSPPTLAYHFKRFLFDECQWAKHPGPGHCSLLDGDIAGVPWEECAVAFIGSWPASGPHGDVEFLALTWIDTTTNLVYSIELRNLAIMLLFF